MARRIGVVAALCCVLALCFALVGCGGSASKADYTGDWKLASSSDANYDEASIKLMRSLGKDVSLTLNDDGKGTLTMLDDQTSVTWEAKSGTEGKLKAGDTETSLTLEGDKLTMDDYKGSSYTFARS